LNIIPKYEQFYKEHRHERLLFFQGGKRSGKTHFICQLLMLIAYTGKHRIYCITADYPRCVDLKLSFTQATGYDVTGSANGYVARIGDSEIYFRSFDTPSKAEQGKECDYAYFYECRSIPIGVVRAIMAGCKVQAFADFNPCEVFWKEEYYPDAPTLVTTYRDNPYLPEILVQDYRAAEERAKLPTATDYDKWWADVFCYGRQNVQARLCFENSELCRDVEYSKCQAPEILAVDFGGEQGGADPTTLIGCKFVHGYIYCKEYYYSNKAGDTALSEALRERKATGERVKALIYETATNGKRRIAEVMRMARATFVTYPCIKGAGSVAGGINDMQGYRLLITESSANFWRERCNYRFEVIDGKLTPQDANNHCFDALRYAYRYYTITAGA
jgi:phage terminase large subunit